MSGGACLHRLGGRFNGQQVAAWPRLFARRPAAGSLKYEVATTLFSVANCSLASVCLCVANSASVNKTRRDARFRDLELVSRAIYWQAGAFRVVSRNPQKREALVKR